MKTCITKLRNTQRKVAQWGRGREGKVCYIECYPEGTGKRENAYKERRH